MSDSQASAPVAHLPAPPSELRAWLLACSIGLIGLGVLVAVLAGAFGSTTAVGPPPVPVTATTPVPGPAAAASALAGATRPGLSAQAGAGSLSQSRTGSQPSSRQALAE